MSAKEKSTLAKWFKRVIILLIAIPIAYLALINTALNIPLTQTLINKIKPEKFQVHWERAWTIYPFTIQAEGISAGGETSSQRWKVDVKKAIASISLLPLLHHKVNIYDIIGTDINFAQEHKKKRDENQSVNTVSTVTDAKSEANNSASTNEKKSREKGKKPWHITVNNAVVHGHHSFSIDKIKGDLDGDLSADVSVETKSGPFAISNGKVDAILHTLQIGKTEDFLQKCKIRGDIEISPIVFSENKGIDMLKFFTVDADIDAQVGKLNFLNLYLKPLKEMKLDGKGALDGHIRFDKGRLLAGTDVKVNASELSLHAIEYSVKGNGRIGLNVTEEDHNELNTKIIFDDLQAYVTDKDTQILLFRGKGLSFDAGVTSSLFPSSATSPVSRMSLEIPSVAVDDIGVFQRYIPKKWHFNLYGGNGELNAKADLQKQHLNAKLKLLSNDADVGINKQHFKSDLDLLVKLDVASASSLQADMSGSYLSLNNSRLSNQKKAGKKESKPWSTRLNIDKGTITLHLPDLSSEGNRTEDRLSAAKKWEIDELLTDADAELAVTGEVSQLEWINFLLKNSLNLSFGGSGTIESDLRIKNGWLFEKSVIRVKPRDLEVGLLDYSFKGDGALMLEVSRGGEKPDVRFAMDLHDARMKRRNEKEAMIENVAVKINGEGRGITFEGPESGIKLHLQIPSAKMKRVSAYNQYLPKDSPFRFVGGSADLKADIKLEPNAAKGYLNFVTNGLTMKVDDQKISARLNAKIKLAGGEPQKMKFDISGSTITLDQARVAGKKTGYNQKAWSAVVQMKRADVIWRKPIWLKSDTRLTIKDSRPIVAMIDNKRDKHGLISKLLTIENIHGIAKVNMANNTITIPNAYVKSDKIDIGAKGIISPNLRDGMFFFRYKKLKGLLKIRNGKKNFDILHVQKTFDNYVVPSVRK